MNRRLLYLDPGRRSYRLETIRLETVAHDDREAYLTLQGESLCQYVLRSDAAAMTLARGPFAFLAGNKATVGYVSPITGVPHYSFVGGRAAAELFNLGLDAVVFSGEGASEVYVVLSGRAPSLSVRFVSAEDVPPGQRGAFYHLVQAELEGNPEQGSVFTVGEGARHGYETSNLAADGIYHAGRGGAGLVFSCFARALVLCGDPLDQQRFFATSGTDPAFARSPNRAIADRLGRYTARLSGQAGGTIPKLYATGSSRQKIQTLPSHNAARLGYKLADLGGRQILTATRDGHTGCHWCPVDCRHWHWVKADYAPDGRDRFLDDFEPTYATFSMLGLAAADDSKQAKIALWREVNRRLILPIEQMGCDIMDIGVGLAALFEGLAQGIVPRDDVPPDLGEALLDGGQGPDQRLDAAVVAVEALRKGVDRERYPALRAVGDGPQALAKHYPAAQEIVFTCGQGTMGNAGHSNALWTFLMPFSRYFGHYAGQIYKIDEQLPDGGDTDALRRVFERVVGRMFDREFQSILCNALSCCAFTYVIFTKEGLGEHLDESDLLVRTLAQYGIQTTRDDLLWFAQQFWAQSIALKAQYGWQPPRAEDLPRRLYESLSVLLGHPVDELVRWMDLLIDVWTERATEHLSKFGYSPEVLGSE